MAQSSGAGNGLEEQAIALLRRACPPNSATGNISQVALSSQPGTGQSETPPISWRIVVSKGKL